MYGIAPIHVLGIIVSVGLLYQSYQLVRRGKEDVSEFLLWAGFGVAIFVFSLGQIVTITGVLAFINDGLSFLGFQSGTNGIFTLAILGILLLLFYTYVNAKSNERKLADLNQQIALLQYEQSQQPEANQRSGVSDD